jgi:hypothetical protein
LADDGAGGEQHGFIIPGPRDGGASATAANTTGSNIAHTTGTYDYLTLLKDSTGTILTQTHCGEEQIVVVPAISNTPIVNPPPEADCWQFEPDDTFGNHNFGTHGDGNHGNGNPGCANNGNGNDGDFNNGNDNRGDLNVGNDDGGNDGLGNGDENWPL